MFKVQLLNQSTLVAYAEVKRIAAALQTQVSRDFAPLYHIDASVTATVADNSQIPIYLVDTVADAPPDALAWHTVDDKNRPYGIVPLQVVKDAGEPLAPVISHELLELLADPYCNATRTAVWPQISKKPIQIAYEICDAVEADMYAINGTQVSDFVSPHWFVPKSKTPWDQLKKLHAPLTLTKYGYLQWSDGRHWHMVQAEKVRGIRQDMHYHSRFIRRSRHLHELLNPGWHEKIRKLVRKSGDGLALMKKLISEL